MTASGSILSEEEMIAREISADAFVKEQNFGHSNYANNSVYAKSCISSNDWLHVLNRA